jgi:hypothetical protein
MRYLTILIFLVILSCSKEEACYLNGEYIDGDENHWVFSEQSASATNVFGCVFLYRYTETTMSLIGEGDGVRVMIYDQEIVYDMDIISCKEGETVVRLYREGFNPYIFTLFNN